MHSRKLKIHRDRQKVNQMVKFFSKDMAMLSHPLSTSKGYHSAMHFCIFCKGKATTTGNGKNGSMFVIGKKKRKRTGNGKKKICTIISHRKRTNYNQKI